MPNAKANIADWNTICLDTTVLIHLLLSASGESDAGIDFSSRLVRQLESNRGTSGRDRVFLVSTISISEIITLRSKEDITRNLITAIGSENVEIVAFDEDIASEMHEGLVTELQAKKPMNDFARSVGFKEHDLVMAREWITRDMMICQTAKNRGADVLLTLDKRTMMPVGAKMEVPCALLRKEMFGASVDGSILYTYEHANLTKVPAA